MELLWPVMAVVGGFAALTWGADRFVIGAAATARNLGVSALVVGLTIVALGTSAPEMLVSTMAAFDGSGDIAIGNALGSNITNVALVLGVTALVRPLHVHSKLIRREMPFLLVVMAVSYGLMWDGELSRVDGGLLLVGFAALIGWSIRQGLSDRNGGGDPLSEEYEQEVPTGMPTAVALGWFSLGLVLLIGSSRVLIWGATRLALHFEVSELVIGLTVVALGTSLPELAASVVAALKNEHDIAVGNVIGSNMFNLLGVLALPGVIAPGPFQRMCLTRDFPVMIAVTLLLLGAARGFGERGTLHRWQGAVLTACFVVYVAYVYVSGG
jgi:cation:H+ antiporter